MIKSTSEKNDYLWAPNTSKIKNSEINKFSIYLNKNNIFDCKQNFKQLWEWSINSSEDFWSSVWDYTKIIGSKKNQILKKEI